MKRHVSLSSQPLGEHSAEFTALATRMIKQTSDRNESRGAAASRKAKNEHIARKLKKYKFDPRPKGPGGGFRQRIEKPISEIIKAAQT